MPVELDERLILVVLAGDVGANFAELLQLLFDLLGGHLDVRLDSSQKLCVVHLCSGIADNLNIFREEFVAVLGGASALLLPSVGEPRDLPNRTALGTAPILSLALLTSIATRFIAIPSSSWRGHPRRPGRR